MGVEHRDRFARFGAEEVGAALGAQDGDSWWWTRPGSMMTWFGVMEIPPTLRCAWLSSRWQLRIARPGPSRLPREGHLKVHQRTPSEPLLARPGSPGRGADQVSGARRGRAELGLGDRLATPSWPGERSSRRAPPQEAFRTLERALHELVASTKSTRKGRRLGFPKTLRKKRKGRCWDSFRFSTGMMRCAGATVTLLRLSTIRTHETAARSPARDEPASSPPPCPTPLSVGLGPLPSRSSVPTPARSKALPCGGGAPSGACTSMPRSLTFEALHEASFVGTLSASIPLHQATSLLAPWYEMVVEGTNASGMACNRRLAQGLCDQAMGRMQQ
jgi:hypothetical protein